jgi:hypothetical protein
MSKQLLKDFKSFLMEAKDDGWEHGDHNTMGYSEDATVVHNLKRDKKTGSRGAVLAFVHGDGDDPYYTALHDGKSADADYKYHSNLKSAVAHLKSKGHEIPDHHLKTFKSRSLQRASDKSK